MYKLVILDYDGTMVGRSGGVTDKVKSAISRAVDNGVKVSISTGRSFFSLRSIIKELNLNIPHVFLAGALVYNPIKDFILKEEFIKPQLVIESNEFSLKNNLYLEAATFDKLYYNLDITAITNRRKKITKENDGLTDFVKLAKNKKILVMRFVVEKENEKNLVEKFQEQMSEDLSFYMGYAYDFPKTDVWNLTDIGVSKISALRHLCGYLKIHPSQTMAIGDSPIDLPLIENVGMGIAMGNAKDLVKKKAKWIAPSVEDDGVVAALEKFILSA